jgi:hypothetical protein
MGYQMADRFRRPPPQPDVTPTEPSLRDELEQLRPIVSFFRKHPAIVGTLLYLQVTTVGVVYSWQLFRRFDINVFYYAETNDFLLAAFRDPIVFGMSVFTIIIVLPIVVATRRLYLRAVAASWRLVLRWERLRRAMTAHGPPLDPVSFARVFTFWFTPIIIVLYSFLPPYFFATLAADSLQSSSYEPLTSVQYRATSGSDKQTTEKGLRVIGTTQSFVFFYERDESRTLIIPNAQIVEMKQSDKKEKVCK